jgi:hypothetical protein
MVHRVFRVFKEQVEIMGLKVFRADWVFKDLLDLVRRESKVLKVAKGHKEPVVIMALKEPKALKDIKEHRELVELMDLRVFRADLVFRDLLDLVHRELKAPKEVKAVKEYKDHKELKVIKDHKEQVVLREFKD